MHLIFTIAISIILSLFSTTVMSYISMAAPIGPWIAPTLVLCATLFFAFTKKKSNNLQDLALVTAAGSVGGIAATAVAFSFPAIYFLDPIIFNRWMAQPVHFASVVGLLVLAAGSYGLWIANICEESLMTRYGLTFPIGQLVYKMISAGNQVRKAFELMAGFVSAMILSVLQDGLWVWRGFIAKSIALIPGFSYGIFSFPALRFDLWPLLWAIGFVTGQVVAIPLLVGALSKIIVLDPINRLFFLSIASMDFMLAFCSGMVLAGAVLGFLISPAKIRHIYNRISTIGITHILAKKNKISRSYVFEALFVITLSCVLLHYFNFGIMPILFLLTTTGICTYQLAIIAGKIGLAPLGRYATFAMVPAMLLFQLNYVQIIVVATFVEIAGGVAADVLFSRKMGHLVQISRWRMTAYQYLGLFICAFSIGIIFWLFINHLHLGSEALFAYKAQSRALLVNAKQFNLVVVCIGFLFGVLLRQLHMNPALVLGGLLMPLNLSIGLIFGGLCTLLTKNKEDYFPFWSGVFAANSIWMLIKAVF